ncbi:hypothetical protein Y013_15050 [Rhodococcus pyridinivorans SB3094]|uniref:Uncharacterized protein n=1 Tax=Rhodococcus pyridinivorans SB3094 TaxID=1435356 RepID=V9XQQ5_9NOCA|nr:hypothetical protein Y013_10930 [Rhodococcus pyridinivorans SB3094]AHD23798.1 hypothetical protein Y013_15050 [Rhodococcus pyridinivorans SB3094]
MQTSLEPLPAAEMAGPHAVTESTRNGRQVEHERCPTTASDIMAADHDACTKLNKLVEHGRVLSFGG